SGLRDLRARGFYLSPAREGWVDDPQGIDFIVHPRGTGPREGEVLHRISVVDERECIAFRNIQGITLAVVDEESDITYFETSRFEPNGVVKSKPPQASGELFGDRILVWDPPVELHERRFYGQLLSNRSGETGPLQLSLVEGAHLATQGQLELVSNEESIVKRGRTVEGEHFDRRLRIYQELRSRGLVPKTGFKFGADFRVYGEFTTVEEMGHSDFLVRVISPDYEVAPRDLALDVRLAHGVRKQMVFARPTEDEICWLAVSRLTP
ncbi:MAG: tRNA-intron lyase, partial [Halobacteriaceae archaeon]